MHFERPPNHPEGDESMCPFLFLKYMQEKNRNRPQPQLIINPSTSSEEEVDESSPPGVGKNYSDSDDSSDEISPQNANYVAPFKPKITPFQSEDPWSKWCDPELEKLLDEAFPMTEEEKAEAGSMLCPTMFFAGLMGSRESTQPVIEKVHGSESRAPTCFVPQFSFDYFLDPGFYQQVSSPEQTG
eukprot:TRINITY_DN4168_c0_g1_i1.p1 TRINITY_DN4168_c0_g1~~TRINITY_DN4168_c0_g1_i1.p1  ORF type:complete len:185 (+),score=30.81 TRINITY_DN4168_c0_g1_i1:185-739(+)